MAAARELTFIVFSTMHHGWPGLCSLIIKIKTSRRKCKMKIKVKAHENIIRLCAREWEGQWEWKLNRWNCTKLLGGGSEWPQLCQDLSPFDQIFAQLENKRIYCARIIEANFQLNRQLNSMVKVLSYHLDDHKRKCFQNLFSELCNLVDYIIGNR